MSEVKDLNKLFENTKNSYLKGGKTTDEELQAAIEAGFDALADYLMNECVFDVNGNEYRIAEIEFYYFDKENHPDVFAHCDKEQLKSNTFYVHNKGGGRAGIDITFGNNNYYGGILIRALKENEFIIGSQKCREQIQKNLDISSLKELKTNLTGVNINKHIIEKTIKKIKPILKSCRVGLNFSNKCQINELEKEYIFRPYRYILNDEELILKLLKSTDSHFLAIMLHNKEFSPKIKKTISEKLDYTKSDSFLKSQKEKRELFLDIFKDKIQT